MRLNRWLAAGLSIGRRQADKLIEQGRVRVDGAPAVLGSQIEADQVVTLDGQPVTINQSTTTILLHKPVGYVCSRRGQGSRTIYELLPERLKSLKPVGRLDKDSSGALLMTTDGALALQLSHPRYGKEKRYSVQLDRPLDNTDRSRIAKVGVTLNDGVSRFTLKPLDETLTHWEVSMREGRNRQIRRTFAALGYEVERLHRTQFGPYKLGTLPSANFRELTPER